KDVSHDAPHPYLAVGLGDGCSAGRSTAQREDSMTLFATTGRAALATTALATALAAPPAFAQSTTYPLTIDNCGVPITFERAPARVVSLGQAMHEIMFA